MKVKIGPYRHNISWGSDLEKAYYRMVFSEKDYLFKDKNDLSVFGKFLVSCFEALQVILNLTVNKIKPQEQKIFVKIDGYDTWSADYTMSYIILPILKQLKEQKHGTPSTDEEDAPHIVYAENISEEEKIWNEDRWNFILDEMIWAFEQIADEDLEDQFWIKNEVTGKREMDQEGYKAYHERIKRGTTLFGKYYRALWT